MYATMYQSCLPLIFNRGIEIRGDVVLAMSPRHPKTFVCKRVIALVGGTD